ncbi:hypothetical protein M9458_023002, partial [Cirrhinus mrigala]
PSSHLPDFPFSDPHRRASPRGEIPLRTPCAPRSARVSLRPSPFLALVLSVCEYK